MAGSLIKAAVSTVGIDPNTFNDVSQSGHFLGGAVAVIAPALFCGLTARWFGAGAMILFSIAKEFWYDYRYENTEVRGSSLEDFAFYCLGILIALAAIQIVLV